MLRRQMDNIYAQKKVENGRTLLPQMYGDPKGYKEKGAPSWYHYTPNLFTDRLAEIYLWSMDRKDLERVPMRGLVGFLEGKDPEYPVKALQADLESFVRDDGSRMEADPTTADTRLADYLHGFESGRETDALANLTMGAYFSAGNIWTSAQPVPVFRSRATARRLAGGCWGAGGEARSGCRDAGSGERRSGGAAHCGGAGGRLWRAPIRVGRDRTARLQPIAGPLAERAAASRARARACDSGWLATSIRRRWRSRGIAAGLEKHNK